MDTGTCSSLALGIARIDSCLRRPRFVNPIAAANVNLSRGNRMLILGAGFVGQYVADQLMREGWNVSGSCTSPIKKRELEEMGLDAFVFDTRDRVSRTVSTLQDATHLLISIPPVAGANDLLLSKDFLCALNSEKLQWICYLSSTSVYGDCGGAYIDEDFPPNPKVDTAKSRLAAEKEWLKIGEDLGTPVNILRLGGIYGPGRSVLDTIFKQKPMSRKQKMRESRFYTARIHVADIYQAIKASLGVPYSRVYNVVDDDPASRAEVFSFACELIKERWHGMNIYAGDDGGYQSIHFRNVTGEKRVSNARLKKELGVKLLHPTYRSGLRSILDKWEPRPCQK